MVREHLDSYLYNLRYNTLDINTSQNPVQIIFNPVQNNNSGTYYRTIHPQSFPIPIKFVLITYLNKLIEQNENLEHTIYRPSHLESLRKKGDYSKYKILKQKSEDKTILTFGYNKIYYK